MSDAKKVDVPEGDDPLKKHNTTDDIEKSIIEAKKRRSRAKAVITQQIGVIDKLTADVRNVAQVKQKVSNFSETIRKFEATHEELLNFLSEEDQCADAHKYKTDVMSQVSEFRDTIQAWIVEQEDDSEVCDAPQETIEMTKEAVRDAAACDVATSHLEEQAEALKKSIEELSNQQQLEMENHKLQLQKEKRIFELERTKLENELMLKRERHRMEEENRKLQAEIRSYENAERQLEIERFGPTTHTTTPLYTPGRPEISSKVQQSQSTPRESQRNPSRVSQEFSQITPNELGEQRATSILTDALHQVLDESRVQQQSLVDTLQMPRCELQMFNGDPLKYWPFIRAFRNTIDCRSTDSGKKLTCLMQYCTGRANSLLQCCLVKEPEEGYQLALKLLEERFGNNFAIAQEWVKKITSRFDVKGIEDLREFADDLMCCKETLQTMGYSTELDNSHHMLSIVEKLPYYLQTRWVRENHSIKLKQKRNSKLSDLVEFINLAADEASDPVFGKVGFKERKGEKEKPPKGKTARRRVGSFAANTVAMTGDSKPESQKSNEKCPCCQQPHYLTQCKKFKGLRVKDRLSLV